jgi:hypothetical protein
VALDLLNGDPILDAGCRGFVFSKWFADQNIVRLREGKKEARVVALDPSPDMMQPMSYTDIVYLREALVGGGDGGDSIREMVVTDDPEAMYLLQPGQIIPPLQRKWCAVQAFNISELSGKVGVSQWDVVKLNIEGSEYGVLSSWPGPISRQITLSWHEHCHPRGDAEVARIMKHLNQWYTVLRHVKEPRYHAGENWWDTCLALTELVKG